MLDLIALSRSDADDAADADADDDDADCESSWSDGCASSLSNSPTT